MKKFHLNISINVKYQHAGTKANVDCKKILLSNDYTDLEINFKKSAYLLPVNLAKLIYHFGKHFFKIPDGSLVMTQYPLLGINRYFNLYAKLLKIKRCTIACIIHDLDSLRYDRKADISGEIKSLNQYDVVVSHNPAMSKWLLQHGYTGKTVDIMLFDYLTDFKPDENQMPVVEPQVTFAGNLARCEFLEHINQIKNIMFNLYGPGLSDKVKQSNSPHINWHGSFPIEDIIFKLAGDYGLIWDGPSIYECIGNMGNSSEYNTPHKLSLYLAAGIPVILPENAALARFVKEQNIGIAVGSIAELSQALSKISLAEYQAMKRSAILIGEKIKQGTYLKMGLTGVEQFLKSA